MGATVLQKIRVYSKSVWLHVSDAAATSLFVQPPRPLETTLKLKSKLVSTGPCETVAVWQC